MARIVKWLEENKGSQLKAKKKISRDPSLMSPTHTRIHGKLDLGVRPKIPGRKNANQVLQEEARRNLADESQRTILECSTNKKRR